MSQQLIDSINTNGFGIISSFLNEHEILLMEQAYNDTLVTVERETKTINPKRLWNLFVNEHILDYALPSEGSILNEVLLCILGKNYLLAGSYSNTIYPGRKEGQIHQDYPFNVLATIESTCTSSSSSSSFSESTVNQENNRPLNYEITTLLALDDFTELNGGTWIIPKSHKYPLGTKVSAETFNKKAIQILAKKGDLIIMHGAAFHRSGGNVTAEKRTAILAMYLQQSQRPQVDPWISLPEKSKQKLGKRSRKMLGAHWHKFDEEQKNKRLKHESRSSSRKVLNIN